MDLQEDQYYFEEESPLIDLHEYFFEEDAPQTDFYDNSSDHEMWITNTNSNSNKSTNCDVGNASSGGGFDCNICLESVQDPVVTLCGHLYCWPCIYKWFNSSEIEENQMKPQQCCPVCKSEISQSTLIPLYGRGQNTLTSCEGRKSQQVEKAIPKRPLGPSFVAASPSVPQEGYYNSPRHHYRLEEDSTYGVFGEMIYARVFGNGVNNRYSYPTNSSYNNLSGIRHRRIIRDWRHADVSLNRISIFLFCFVVLCLLTF